MAKHDNEVGEIRAIVKKLILVTDHVPTTYRPHTDQILPTTYRPPFTDDIPTAFYRPHTDQILPTTYPPPFTDHIPTAFTDHIPTDELVHHYQERERYFIHPWLTTSNWMAPGKNRVTTISTEIFKYVRIHPNFASRPVWCEKMFLCFFP